MAACANHPDREAPLVCSGCGGAFCDACVVRFEKLSFCESCKARYLAGVDEGPRPARTAPGAKPRRERKALSPGNRPLDWALGAVALAFSAIFAVVIVAALATPVKALLEDRKMSTAFDHLVQVGAAIERYRAATGKYPETLEALVPTYLNEIPDDPYAKHAPRAPHYETAPSHRLWSIGPDEKDDGGEEPNDLVYAVEPVAGT